MARQIKPRKYGQTEMTDEESLIFVETCLEQGADPSEALQDMRMIDTMFSVQRVYFFSHGYNRTTRSGNPIKNRSVSDMLMRVIDARADGVKFLPKEW